MEEDEGWLGELPVELLGCNGKEVEDEEEEDEEEDELLRGLKPFNGGEEEDAGAADADVDADDEFSGVG